jgi:hypothetical protein
MKREIKFRVYDKLEERFIKCDEGYQGHYVLSLKGEFHNLQNGSGGNEYIVQQFTGLKDSDGEDIYEGDTLIWYSENFRIYEAKVVFSPTVAAFVLDVSGRHLIDGKYGDFQHLYEGHSYKIKK